MTQMKSINSVGAPGVGRYICFHIVISIRNKHIISPLLWAI